MQINERFPPRNVAKWIIKIKKGGFLIGRDFRQFRSAFYNLGYKEEDFKKCVIGKRASERLEYLVVNVNK